MGQKRVTEEGEVGRREINQFNKQRASYPRISCTGGIMWLGNLAQRSGSWWSHQSQSEAKAWFLLSSNGSLPTRRGRIERSKCCRRLILFSASRKCSRSTFSEKSQPTQWALPAGALSSPLTWGLHCPWYFLTGPGHPAAVRHTAADLGGEVFPLVSFPWASLAKWIGSFDSHSITTMF